MLENPIDILLRVNEFIMPAVLQINDLSQYFVSNHTLNYAIYTPY